MKRTELPSEAVTDDALLLRSRRGRGVVAATVLGSSVAFLDTTVVNVALPTLGRALGASFSGLQWTVDAYMLSLSALVLVGGALGDRFGRRRVFQAGLAGFALTSASCSLAPSVGILAAARALQGASAALLVPGSLAILRASFAERDRAAAIGAWAGLSGVATAAGPLLGGWLVDAVSWRAIFFINVPVIALAIEVTRRCVPETRSADAARLDLPGALAAFVGLGGLTYGLIALPQAGHAEAAASLAAGAIGLAVFLVREHRCPRPMLPLAIFRSRQLTGANVVTLAVYFALGGASFLFVLYLQRVLGCSALAAGAAMTPITVLVLVLSPVAGRLAPRIGYRPLMTLGPLIAATGLALMGRVHPGAGYLESGLPGISILGLGLGLTVAPLTSAVLSGADARYAGIASGVNNAVARTAGLLAVALLPLVSGSAAGTEALATGFPRAMATAAVACALGGAVAFWTVRGRPG